MVDVEEEVGRRLPTTVVQMVPDYAAIESINRMPSLNSTWTADRDGFVSARCSPGSTTSVSLRINGTRVFRTHVSNESSIYFTEVVAKGDVLSWDAGSGASDFVCYFIPPRYVWVAEEAVTLNARLIGQPDYANMESINRMSTSTFSWTNNQGDGYVYVGGQGNSADGYAMHVEINGSRVFEGAINTNNRHYTTLPISNGDTVAIATPSSSDKVCYFIPPKSVAPRFVTGSDFFELVNASSFTVPGEPNLPMKASKAYVTNTANPSISWVADQNGWAMGEGSASPNLSGFSTKRNGVTIPADPENNGSGAKATEWFRVYEGDTVTVTATTPSTSSLRIWYAPAYALPISCDWAVS
jgi:hypothetical protein